MGNEREPAIIFATNYFRRAAAAVTQRPARAPIERSNVAGREPRSIDVKARLHCCVLCRHLAIVILGKNGKLPDFDNFLSKLKLLISILWTA